MISCCAHLGNGHDRSKSSRMTKKSTSAPVHTTSPYLCLSTRKNAISTYQNERVAWRRREATLLESPLHCPGGRHIFQLARITRTSSCRSSAELARLAVHPSAQRPCRQRPHGRCRSRPNPYFRRWATLDGNVALRILLRL